MVPATLHEFDPPPTEGEIAPERVARERELGGISRATLHRWAKRFPDFPQPIRINGRKYFRVSELRRWVKKQECSGETRGCA